MRVTLTTYLAHGTRGLNTNVYFILWVFYVGFAILPGQSWSCTRDPAVVGQLGQEFEVVGSATAVEGSGVKKDGG